MSLIFEYHFFQLPLNIERSTLAEMRVAESRGEFEYQPNLDPATIPTINQQSLPFGSAGTTTIPTIGATSAVNAGDEPSLKENTPPALKRKNSLDDFELEIEGMNLDDNIDTSVSP